MEKNVDGGALATVKKILASIDRSGYKEQILAFATSLGKAWGAEITAIHVIDPGRGVPGGRVKEKEQEREEEAKREAEDLLVQSVDPLAQKEGVNIKKEVVEESDSVAKSIIGLCKEEQYGCYRDWY